MYEYAVVHAQGVIASSPQAVHDPVLLTEQSDISEFQWARLGRGAMSAIHQQITAGKNDAIFNFALPFSAGNWKFQITHPWHWHDSCTGLATPLAISSQFQGSMLLIRSYPVRNPLVVSFGPDYKIRSFVDFHLWPLVIKNNVGEVGYKKTVRVR